MSLRDALKQSIGSTQEICCTVAPLRGCNNATNNPKAATVPATNSATMSPEASNVKVFRATRDATTAQQTPEEHATNKTLANTESEKVTQIEIELVRRRLCKIGEPEQDHHLVLDKCRNGPEAMEYFFKYASGEFDE